MAENVDSEKKIPVLTVLKNHSILKNIFILDPLQEENSGENVDAFEETVWIGRHPDCNIILEHPSISRFHLRIDFKPCSLLLSVKDLSSVHGTWVCGNKIKPNVRVYLNEGDTLRLGGSSRIYRLHWVPMSIANDLEQPFVPPMDLSDLLDDMELEEEQSQTLDASRDLDDLLSDMKSVSSVEELIPSVTSIPTDDAFSVAEGEENHGVSGNKTSLLQLFHEADQESNDKDAPVTLSVADQSRMVSLLESPDTSPLRSAQKTALSVRSGRGICDSIQVFTCKSKENRSSASAGSEVNSTDDDVTEIESISRNLFPCENDEDDKETYDSGMLSAADQYQTNSTLESTETPPVRSAHKSSPLIWSRNGKSARVQITAWVGPDTAVDASDHNTPAIDSMLKDMCSWNPNDVEEIFTPDKENLPFDTSLIGSLRKTDQDSLKNELILKSVKSFSDADGDEIFTPDKEKWVGADTQDHSSDHDNSTIDSIFKDLCSWDPDGVEEIFTPDKENLACYSPLIRSLRTADQDNMNELILKSVKFFSDEDDDEIYTPDKENITPDTLRSKGMKKIRKIQVLKEKSQELPVFNNENLSPISVPKYIASSCEEHEDKIYTPDKENITLDTLRYKFIKKMRDIASSFEEHEDKIYTPDKENITPDTLRSKSVKKMRELEEIKDTNSLTSSPLKNMTGFNRNEESHVLTASNSKNQVPAVLLGQNTRNYTSSVETKLMLQLIGPKGEEDQDQNDPMRTRSKESINHPLTQAVKNLQNNATRVENTTRWTMVVDTASLLKKESRQALTLLQGLTRTSLIIPSIVMRELHGIKRSGGFFSRTNEASSALQWIEDCKENEKWWIHVESYEEEERTIAATPPAATPLSWFRGENWMFSINWFSPSDTLRDTISPTLYDHILECASLVRTSMNGRLVLLSDDVTLKIKAMAEGILCESADQFREGLVNPFSERFLWTDSAPRGLAWSCMDDVVLREKFYSGPSKNLSKAGKVLKGLKVILLHNSEYRKLTPISPMA
ncbi:hypothetical protein LIER_24607 [Lithospermum erythrorhizon]|uniref:FHA domain-containing protein n=1 Tax=Lithospermum erythrorhizon TaxID=34254 RepID=A0AAV3R5E5_LITER